MTKCIIDMMETRTTSRTIEAQIVQKLRNNEARQKFTAGSYKKKGFSRLKCCSCATLFSTDPSYLHVLLFFFKLYPPEEAAN